VIVLLEEPQTECIHTVANESGRIRLYLWKAASDPITESLSKVKSSNAATAKLQTR
jgi:hypothetical protein